MTLFLFLTVVQAIVAAGLVAAVLMQRSEGGGLGIGGGGSPGGLMSARGAADVLTRTTKWLAVMFVALSIALAALAIRATSGGEIVDTIDRSTTDAAASDTILPVTDGIGEAAQGADQQSPAATDDPLSGIAE